MLAKSKSDPKEYIVSKHNKLNEIRNCRMSITQLRFFAIYLSKLNPLNIDSREVTFKLEEYLKLMDFKKLHIKQLKKSASELTALSVCIDEIDEKGKFIGFANYNLFSCFKFYKQNDDWYVTINCNDYITKYIFKLKEYLSYELWNALQLKSPNQLRMYEILKQYENLGFREVSVLKLREYLGIESSEYEQWTNFKRRILDVAQKALAAHTDLKFTWEVSSRGSKGKIIALRFNIEKNEDFLRQYTFDEYLAEQSTPIIESENAEEFEIEYENEFLGFLADACDHEFKESQIAVLHGMIAKVVPPCFLAIDMTTHMYDYLTHKYKELNHRASRKDLPPIKNRFGYIKKLIQEEYNKEYKGL